MPEGKPEWDGKADTPILEGEEVILDENGLAEGHSYCSVGSCKVCVGVLSRLVPFVLLKHIPSLRLFAHSLFSQPSPSQKFLAYSLDNVGGETYTLFVKDLTTGEIVEKVSRNQAGKVKPRICVAKRRLKK